MHFSKDLLSDPIEEFNFQSRFRQRSPLRRRNPENLFPCYEANLSQNYEKWAVIAYRKTDEPHR